MGRFETKTSLEGSVTIPSEVLDALGLKPGETVEFVVAADGGVALQSKAASLAELKTIFSNSQTEFDTDNAIEETVALRTNPTRTDADP